MVFLIARFEDLVRAAKGKGVKLVVAKAFEGEGKWEGMWKEGEVIESRTFEIGFASPSSSQELHAHETVYEIYLFLGKGLVKYLEGEEVREVNVEMGDLVVFPPKVYHEVKVFERGAYVISVCESTDCKLGGDKVRLER